MWLSTLQTLGGLAGSHFPKVAKGAADALERLVLEVRHRFFILSYFVFFCLFLSFFGLFLGCLYRFDCRAMLDSLCCFPVKHIHARGGWVPLCIARPTKKMVINLWYVCFVLEP